MLERIRNHIIAFVVIILLIASAPLLTFAAALWMASVKRVDPDEIILSVMVGTVFVAFWYMFVASITRMARAKREGVSPRTGFLWAGGRLFGGWFLSFGSAILRLFGVDRFVGAFGINSPSRILFPALFLGVWSPVIVNLLRHFMRYFTPHAPIASPAADVANDQTPMLGGREVLSQISPARARSEFDLRGHGNCERSGCRTRVGVARAWRSGLQRAR